MNKINIFFIQPLNYDPTLPNFKDMFEILSEKFTGQVVVPSDKQYRGLAFGNFQCYSLPVINHKFLRFVVYTVRIILLGIRFNRKKSFEYIHSWDPLMFGFSATILKWLTGAKLIVEVNGHFKKDAFLGGKRQFFKKSVFNFLIWFSLKNADIIKFLNNEQVDEWRYLLKNKTIRVFHVFVPTHIFNPDCARDERYILFMGHPFHRKGVDILIRAFIKIADKFPDIRLKIIGHCHGREKERDYYLQMANGNPRVEILKPVFFDEAVKIMHNCTFFVLPSRSEAMGRVLIETMACGKAVIGARVGGIPGLIEDGKNGFLFESENISDLAEKMDKLLSDVELRKRLGKSSLEIIQSKFSSQKYVKYFLDMIESEKDSHEK
ncbi:MAG TPA: glycosyltransferase family 4 protein [Candidatus Omnitrophota bacterium]|nr:glycosyltransferase family 4 protein [Candidatus Omnitrophota bacterium]HPD85181.1 glycosyltransferase family 4 protein [Candidatus Omnitrophota bacterium]HRZ04318.1 glycosyltransferase family 4 protein [Candidatus Omnitrophota bacterium]